MTAVAFVAIVAFVYGLLIGMQMCVPIAMWLNEVDMDEKMKEKAEQKSGSTDAEIAIERKEQNGQQTNANI